MPGKKNLLLPPAFGLTIAFLLFLFITNTSFAQEYSKLDSLKIGTKYKIILFDDTEIIGTVISTDSSFVTVNTGKNYSKVKKDDIFNISRNLTPSQYSLLLSAAGGVIFPGAEFFYRNNRDYDPSLSFQLNSAFVVSSNKAFRIDLSYSKLVRKKPYYVISSTGGNVNMVSLSFDFVIGELKPESFFTAYGILGLGMHYTFIPAYTETVSWGYDTTYNTYTSKYEEESRMNAVLRVGGGLGVKLSKHLTVFGEVQYNSVTYGGFLFFAFGQGYIPVRFGLTYMLF
jgi:hypothetical protein